MRFRLAVLALVLAAPLAAAHAAPAARCVATEILASNEKKGVDPRLDSMKSKLGAPPLSSFDTFKVIGQQTLTLERQKPASSPLTYGHLTLLFKDQLAVQGGKARLRVGVDLDDKDGHRKVSTVVVVDSGGSVMIAGEPYQNGTYILNLACTAP